MKEMTINGWIVRDADGSLWICNSKPERVKKAVNWKCYNEMIALFEELFPDITWESEPKEAKITIKIKE